MSNNKRVFPAALAVGCFAVALHAVPAEAAGFLREQPLPQQIYIVTQRAADGSILMTERAVDYTYTDGGCIKYRTPEDQSRNLPKWRIICGSPVSVKPEEK